MYIERKKESRALHVFPAWCDLILRQLIPQESDKDSQAEKKKEAKASAFVNSWNTRIIVVLSLNSVAQCEPEMPIR